VLLFQRGCHVANGEKTLVARNVMLILVDIGKKTCHGYRLTILLTEVSSLRASIISWQTFREKTAVTSFVQRGVIMQVHISPIALQAELLTLKLFSPCFLEQSRKIVSIQCKSKSGFELPCEWSNIYHSDSHMKANDATAAALTFASLSFNEEQRIGHIVSTMAVVVSIAANSVE
jgi:hypothetical protein